MRDLKFTIEEIVQIYDPTHSIKQNGMVDIIRTLKGLAVIDDNGEVKLFSIDESEVNTLVGDKHTTTSDKGIFRRLIKMIASK